MIHSYSLNGYNITLDIGSGAVHVLDDISHKIVNLITPPMADECPTEIIKELANEYTVDDIVDSYDELHKLYEDGLFFSEDPTYDTLEMKSANSPIKSMCLNIAHDCNLRCEYCFASKGDFGKGRMLMPFEVGKAAIDFMIEKSGTRRNLELDFFGGEPLMNFDVVKKVVEYARSIEKEHNKNFRFTITTNGTLLDDDKIAFINKEMSNVVLSIDGRKEVNDKLRIYSNGKGCYDAIVPKFQKLVQGRHNNPENRKDYYARGTFTAFNLDFASDVKEMFDLGFDQTSVEPVVCQETLPYALKPDMLPKIFDEYDRLANMIIERKKKGEKINFFHFMIDLDQGPCIIKRLKGCGCGNEYVAVTPEGDIYPCHQFVGMDEWKMGNLLDKTFNDNEKKRFSKANIYNKKGCNDCWAKYYCSGGCNANNFEYAGDILNPYEMSCKIERKRVECSIMIKAALADNQ